MPADFREVEDAEREGIKLMFLVAPKSFKAGPDGRVAGLVCEKMKLGRPMPADVRRPSRFPTPNLFSPVTQSSPPSASPPMLML